MNLTKLKRAAEKRVSLQYDAWAELSGAVRKSLVIQEMLIMLEEQEGELFKAKMLTARSAWETRAFAATHENLAQFLCDAGGRYRNARGDPSGVAYDLAAFVSIVWEGLLEAGYNPLEIATAGWTKARVTVATIRAALQLLDENGEETGKLESVSKVMVRDQQAIDRVVGFAVDEEVSAAEMMGLVQERRVARFGMMARLETDGTWTVAAHLTDKQFALVQRLLQHHASIQFDAGEGKEIAEHGDSPA